MLKFKFYGLALGLMVWGFSGLSAEADGDCNGARDLCMNVCSKDIIFKSSTNNCGGFCELIRKKCAGELQGQDSLSQ